MLRASHIVQPAHASAHRTSLRAALAVACAAGWSAATPPTVEPPGEPLPPGAVLRLGSQRFRHPDNVIDLALAPDGRTVVTIGRKELIAWDAVTGQPRWRADVRLHGVQLPGAAYGVRPLAFLPDGRLATPALDNEIILWDAATGRNETIQTGDEPPIEQLAAAIQERHAKAVDVSPDGERFALGGAAGVVVCDRQGRVLFRIVNPVQGDVDAQAMTDRLLFGGHAASGQFSPTGDAVAVNVSAAPDVIQLVDAGAGEVRRRVQLKARMVRLAFSPDGAKIAVTERDGAVRLYDAATGERLWSRVIELTNPYENYTSAIAFSPDGASIAACATDNRIYLLDAANGEVVGQLEGHTWYPWAVAFSNDGQMLYSSGWDGPVRRWNLATREQLPLPAGVRATGVVAVAPDGSRVAYEDDAGRVRLVDAESGEEMHAFEQPGARFSQLAFSPDGAHLAGGGSTTGDVCVLVWRLADGEAVHQWKWPKGRDPHSQVESLAFSPDGRRLAAAMFRQDAVVWWDLQSGDEMARRDDVEEIYGLSFSPDGRTLATVGWDSTLRLWDAETGAMGRGVNVGNLAPGVGANDDLRMYAVAYAPHGGLLATQHMNGEVWIWDATAVEPINKVNLGRSFSYGSLSFAPSGLWFAAGSSSGEVSLHDAWTGDRVWVADAHEDTIYTTGFSRDGRRLVTGGDDGVCYLWDLYPRWTPLHDQVEGLWTDLAGDDSQAAFLAYLELADQPQRTIPLIAEKLRGVHTLLDPNVVDEGTPDDEAGRQRRLQQLLVERDPGVERLLAARRAIALLVQFNSSEARAVLQELAAEHPDGDVAPLASAPLAELDREASGGQP